MKPADGNRFSDRIPGITTIDEMFIQIDGDTVIEAQSIKGCWKLVPIKILMTPRKATP
jgi:hypothetical protein